LATEERNIETFSLNGKSQSVPILKNSFGETESEIQQIISARPPFIVRWGTVFFFLLLVLLVTTCWFIKYPDIITATARLNSINAPKEIITRTDGKLHVLLVENGSMIKEGDVIGFMESIAKHEAVNQLKVQVDSISLLITQNRTNEIVQYFPDYQSRRFLYDLGEIQQSFQTFILSFTTFKDYISNGFYLRKRNMLQADMSNINKLHGILNEQKKLLEEDVRLSNETFKANETLADDKVISPLDYRNEKSKLIARQLSLPQVNSSIVNNEAQQNEKRKEIAELENQIQVQKNSFVQALQTLNSQIQQWEYKYVLRAPVSGRISFAGFFQENQYLKNGQLLTYVEPAGINYFAEVLIPQYNFGKVKSGQNVLLKFQAYPYEQFGSVQGKIEFISNISSDSGFLAKVQLPNGLLTNYQKQLQYRNGLQAQANIITEDMRLLQRFYYNIIRQIKR
jgi:multidrug efflux pump subunit AcrA (membrane-fusion protein)